MAYSGGRRTLRKGAWILDIYSPELLGCGFSRLPDAHRAEGDLTSSRVPTRYALDAVEFDHMEPELLVSRRRREDVHVTAHQGNDLGAAGRCKQLHDEGSTDGAGSPKDRCAI
jgi:hypothetical protein